MVASALFASSEEAASVAALEAAAVVAVLPEPPHPVIDAAHAAANKSDTIFVDFFIIPSSFRSKLIRFTRITDMILQKNRLVNFIALNFLEFKAIKRFSSFLPIDFPFFYRSCQFNGIVTINSVPSSSCEVTRMVP